MSDWRPLSKRGQADERLDEPTEGLPPYLAGPLMDWLQKMFTDSYSNAIRIQALKNLQLSFKLEQPLDWRNEVVALNDLVGRVGADAEFGLDVIDFVLNHIGAFVTQYDNPRNLAGEAAMILRVGGSAWEVSEDDSGRAFRLSRRAVGPVRDAIEDIPSSTRAHQHLVVAWNRLSGRNPDESGAYREAIRAVEAAAKPIVLPENDRATLGTMISAMRDKPEKWTARLASVEDVRRMMEAVWKSQLDRHGTDDEETPFSVSPEQADAAFAICLNLVRLFAGGHVQPAAGA